MKTEACEGAPSGMTTGLFEREVAADVSTDRREQFNQRPPFSRALV